MPLFRGRFFPSSTVMGVVLPPGTYCAGQGVVGARMSYWQWGRGEGHVGIGSVWVGADVDVGEAMHVPSPT